MPQPTAKSLGGQQRRIRPGERAKRHLYHLTARLGESDFIMFNDSQGVAFQS